MYCKQMGGCKFYEKRGRGKRKNTQPYPLAWKLQIISEYKAGNISFVSLGKKHDLNPGLINYWVRKYEGRLKADKFPIILRKFKAVKPAQPENEDQQVKALKQQLEEALLRNKALEAMIAIAEEEFKINIRKKSGTKPSAS